MQLSNALQMICQRLMKKNVPDAEDAQNIAEHSGLWIKNSDVKFKTYLDCKSILERIRIDKSPKLMIIDFVDLSIQLR